MTFGDIIRSFAPPALNPAGITFNGKNLLVACGGDGRIHEVDRETGASIRNFAYISLHFVLCYIDGSRLLQSNGGEIIYLTDLSGNLIRTFPNILPYVYGVTYMGGGMFIQTGYSGTHNSLLIFRELSGLAPEIRRVNTGNIDLAGLCFDGKDIYAADYGANRLRKISIDGDIIASAVHPARPIGVAFDGKSLWVTNDTTDLIYCVSVN